MKMRTKMRTMKMKMRTRTRTRTRTMKMKMRTRTRKMRRTRNHCKRLSRRTTRSTIAAAAQQKCLEKTYNAFVANCGTPGDTIGFVIFQNAFTSPRMCSFLKIRVSLQRTTRRISTLN